MPIAFDGGSPDKVIHPAPFRWDGTGGFTFLKYVKYTGSWGGSRGTGWLNAAGSAGIDVLAWGGENYFCDFPRATTSASAVFYAGPSGSSPKEWRGNAVTYKPGEGGPRMWLTPSPHGSFAEPSYLSRTDGSGAFTPIDGSFVFNNRNASASLAQALNAAFYAVFPRALSREELNAALYDRAWDEAPLLLVVPDAPDALEDHSGNEKDGAGTGLAYAAADHPLEFARGVWRPRRTRILYVPAAGGDVSGTGAAAGEGAAAAAGAQVFAGPAAASAEGAAGAVAALVFAGPAAAALEGAASGAGQQAFAGALAAALEGAAASSGALAFVGAGATAGEGAVAASGALDADIAGAAAAAAEGAAAAVGALIFAGPAAAGAEGRAAGAGNLAFAGALAASAAGGAADGAAVLAFVGALAAAVEGTVALLGEHDSPDVVPADLVFAVRLASGATLAVVRTRPALAMASPPKLTS